MSKPKKQYAPTKLPGGIPRLIQICEDMRTRNTDGYLKGSLWLAKVKSPKLTRTTKAVVCSPLTGGLIAVAFDPKYPRDDLNGDPYQPLCNGGTEPLPHNFYTVLNSECRNSGALADYGLGKKIKMTEMRRGDLVGIDWKGGGGHSTFVWDVHLNAKGEVDCFQMLGSHGSLSSNGFGLHIHGCTSEYWFKGKPAAPGKPGTGTLSKAKAKVFVDDDEIVRLGTWFPLPGVSWKGIDRSTFRVTPKTVGGHVIGQLDVGRMNYDGDPPAPYCMKGGPGAPPPSPPVPEVHGHVDAPVTTVKKSEAKKVEPKPAPQDKKKPLMMQKDVETAMAEFFHAKWIDKDPGVPDDVNDPKSQAAIKAFQKLFKLDADGIVGKITRAAIKKQLPAVQKQVQAEEMLFQLFKAGKLTKDPGAPNGFNDAGTAATLKEFQKSAGLPDIGVPCADTQEKLAKAVGEIKASSSKHGPDPVLSALYWLGNQVAPGGNATLRLHSSDLKTSQNLTIFLKDVAKGTEVEAPVKIVASAAKAEVSVAIPAAFGGGASLLARVKADLDGGKKVELLGKAPLYVRDPGFVSIELLDPDGEPFAEREAQVIFDSGETRKAKTDKTGQLRIENPPAGQYTVEVDGIVFEFA